MRTIQDRKVEYVFGVYNQLIVAVYKPDEWHYVYDMVDVPRVEELDAETLERGKNRVYFICRDYEAMDENQWFYLHKSIEDQRSFQPFKTKYRKPGTGCLYQINDHLWEGRYSPRDAHGKRISRNVYAKTKEECEIKLAAMIEEMKKEIAEEKEKMKHSESMSEMVMQ